MYQSCSSLVNSNQAFAHLRFDDSSSFNHQTTGETTFLDKTKDSQNARLKTTGDMDPRQHPIQPFRHRPESPVDSIQVFVLQ